MNTKAKVVSTSLVLGLIALLAGHSIWPPSPMLPVPTDAQFPLFAFLAIVEALSFGLGVSFIVFGWPLLKHIPPQWQTKARWSFAAIVWMLVSWWPHDNLHQHIGINLRKLLYIEYGFHLTLVIASCIVAYTLVSFLRAYSAEA